MPQQEEHYSYRIYADPRIAEGFDADRFGGRIGEFIKQHQEDAMFRILPDVSGWKVVDVGAGTGRITIPFLQRGALVTACDASNQMLSVLRNKSNAAGLRVQVADAHALQFADREFDCAVSFRMLLHVIDWKKALSELCRVSADWLIFDVPPRRGFLRLAPVVHAIKKTFANDVQTYRTFALKDLTAEIEHNQFRIVNTDPGFFLPIAVHRLVRSPVFSRISENAFRKMHLTVLFGSPLTIFARRRK